MPALTAHCRRILLPLLLLTAAAPLFAQTPPPAATAPAPAPAVKNIDALLPDKSAAWNFSNAPIADVIAFVGKTYGVTLKNPYSLEEIPPVKKGERAPSDSVGLAGKPVPIAFITIKLKEPVATRDALILLNQNLIPLGYYLAEELKGTPPALELRVARTTQQRDIPVHNGADPAQIPDDNELRTQVLYLPSVDPDKAREMITAVLDKRAEVVNSAVLQSMIITDSAAHIRTAASLLQVLEKQAAAAKPGPQK